MWPRKQEVVVARQRNRQRTGYYLDRTMAVVFKTWHINTGLGYYDVVNQTAVQFKNPRKSTSLS